MEEQTEGPLYQISSFRGEGGRDSFSYDQHSSNSGRNMGIPSYDRLAMLTGTRSYDCLKMPIGIPSYGHLAMPVGIPDSQWRMTKFEQPHLTPEENVNNWRTKLKQTLTTLQNTSGNAHFSEMPPPRSTGSLPFHVTEKRPGAHFFNQLGQQTQGRSSEVHSFNQASNKPTMLSLRSTQLQPYEDDSSQLPPYEDVLTDQRSQHLPETHINHVSAELAFIKWCYPSCQLSNVGTDNWREDTEYQTRSRSFQLINAGTDHLTGENEIPDTDNNLVLGELAFQKWCS